jgi:hypothetical protein
VEKKEEQVKILSRTHDISHLGRDKLLSVVQHKYYWPGLYTDATEYVRMCVCACKCVHVHLFADVSVHVFVPKYISMEVTKAQ